jgi:hypothetical protein
MGCQGARFIHYLPQTEASDEAACNLDFFVAILHTDPSMGVLSLHAVVVLCMRGNPACPSIMVRSSAAAISRSPIVTAPAWIPFCMSVGSWRQKTVYCACEYDGKNSARMPVPHALQ